MTELDAEIGLNRPMIGWECSECGEPYNSKKQPDQHMCVMCENETIWELPADVVSDLQSRLAEATVGDVVRFVPDAAASMKGTVTKTTERKVWLDEEGERPRVIVFGDPEVEDSTELAMHDPEDEYDFGDDIHHLEVVPEDEVEEEPEPVEVTGSLTQFLAENADEDIDVDSLETGDVENVSMSDGSLKVTIQAD